MNQNSPEEFSKILKRLLSKPKYKQKTKIQKIRKTWILVLGQDLSEYTRISSHFHGVLKVEVANSVVLHELSCFRKQELIQNLQEKLPSYSFSEIKFFLGAF